MGNAIEKAYKVCRKKIGGIKVEQKIEELKDLLAEYGINLKKEEKKTSPVVIVLAVIGAIAAVAAIAYAVFYFFVPEDSEDFEDFDEDDFEDMDLED